MDIKIAIKKSTSIVADIYISGDGNDTNDGSTPLLAIATISRLYQLLSDNITIAFNCGYTYYGSIILNDYSNILITKYGSGSNPLISSIITSTNITQNGNIYSVTDTNLYDESVESQSGTPPDNVYYLNTVNNVIVDGVEFQKCRYPKTGYLTSSGGSSTTLVDNDLGDPSGY